MKKLTLSTKLFYGLGSASRGIKDGLFQLFLFFYFSQVLGLDAKLAGLSSLLALIIDAVSDPLVGLMSDKWESKKWGRRHPFMFASAVPLGLFSFILFSPPAGLSEMGLFLWLTIFTILVRVSITFFEVPFTSLGAELSTDYNERTSITAIRIMFAAVLSPVVMVIGYGVFFVPTEAFPNGLLNESVYPKFALLCSVLMIIFILISAWGTRHVIPDLPKPSSHQSQMTTRQLLKSLGLAFKMPSFRSIVFFHMFLFIGLGIGVILAPYFAPYFFELSTAQMTLLPISSAVGGLLSMFIAPNLGRFLDKRAATILGAIIAGLFFTLPFSLSLLGLFPAPGSTLLPIAYTGFLTVAYTSIWIAFSTAASMMADVVDEFELQSGNRQEGLFFSSMSFAYKMTTGVGALIAGFLLTWIEFPKQTDVADVPKEVIENLGIIGGPVLMVLYLVAATFLFFYPITKERYSEIRAGLDAKIK